MQRHLTLSSTFNSAQMILLKYLFFSSLSFFVESRHIFVEMRFGISRSDVNSFIHHLCFSVFIMGDIEYRLPLSS